MKQHPNHDDLIARAESLAQNVGVQVLPGWAPDPNEEYDTTYTYEDAGGVRYLVLLPLPKCPTCNTPMEDRPDYWQCRKCGHIMP